MKRKIGIPLICISMLLIGCNEEQAGKQSATDVTSEPEVMETVAVTDLSGEFDCLNPAWWSLCIETVSVDQAFLDAVYEKEPAAHIAAMFEESGELAEPYASQFCFAQVDGWPQEQTGALDEIRYATPFVVPCIEKKVGGGDSAMRFVHILPVMLDDCVCGYFSWSEEDGGYENYHWNPLLDDEMRRCEFPGGYTFTMYYAMMAYKYGWDEEGSSNMLVMVEEKPYLINDSSGWYRLPGLEVEAGEPQEEMLDEEKKQEDADEETPDAAVVEASDKSDKNASNSVTDMRYEELKNWIETASSQKMKKLVMLYDTTDTTTGESLQEKLEKLFGLYEDKNTDKPVTYLKEEYDIDYGNLYAVAGDADYIFVGIVESNEGTYFENKETEENGEQIETSDACTDYTVTVLKNIKGSLRTDKPVLIRKFGGLSYDHETLYLLEGDVFPFEEETYIFFANAQKDGSLFVYGPVSNIPLNIDRTQLADGVDRLEETAEYQEVLAAYKNQIDSGRERYASSYEQ